MTRFKENQSVILNVQGAGVTSTESHVISKIDGDIISLSNSPKTFDLSGQCLEQDPFFGFKFWITTGDEQ